MVERCFRAFRCLCDRLTNNNSVVDSGASSFELQVPPIFRCGSHEFLSFQRETTPDRKAGWNFPQSLLRFVKGVWGVEWLSCQGGLFRKASFILYMPEEPCCIG